MMPGASAEQLRAHVTSSSEAMVQSSDKKLQGFIQTVRQTEALPVELLNACRDTLHCVRQYLSARQHTLSIDLLECTQHHTGASGASKIAHRQADESSIAQAHQVQASVNSMALIPQLGVRVPE